MWRRVDLAQNDILEERWFTQELRGVTSQKMAFFIATTVKTSNLKILNHSIYRDTDNVSNNIPGICDCFMSIYNLWISHILSCSEIKRVDLQVNRLLFVLYNVRQYTIP
jgi:hypothetical protein